MHEVYSLSAIDLFASAMGAFIIISIILMPDYQKEVRSIGDLEYLEELAGQTQALLDETEQGRKDVLDALLAAQTRHQRLQAEFETVSAELQTLEAEQQARADQPPPPPPSPRNSHSSWKRWWSPQGAAARTCRKKWTRSSGR